MTKQPPGPPTSAQARGASEGSGPTERFLLKELSTDTGLWRAALRYAPVDAKGRRKETDYVVILYERESGVVWLDWGGREAGERQTTRTRSRAKAIERAERLLLARVRGDLDEDLLEAKIVEAKNSPTILLCFEVWLAYQRAHPGEVTKGYVDNVKRVRDIVEALFGPEALALHCNQAFVDDYIRARTSRTLTFFNERRPLAPVRRKTTPVKELGVLSTVLSFCAALPVPGREEQTMLARNPLAGRTVKIPDRNDTKPKVPLLAEQYNRLMIPLRRADGTVVPAPVDRVPGARVGMTRLATAMGFNFAPRRSSLAGLKRRHVATTSDEVRAILAKLAEAGLGVVPDWAWHYPNGIIELDPEFNKEGKRSDKDPLDWWRFVPISKDLRAELDLFHRRTGFYDWAPDAPVFGDADGKPLDLGLLFDSAQHRRAERDGQRNYDRQGNVVGASKGDPLFKPDGSPRLAKKPGWYRQAEEIAREDARVAGLDPNAVYPLYKGEVYHGWRSGLAKRVGELGYLREVLLDKQTGEYVNYNENARYFLGRSVDHDVLVRVYLGINPEVLAAIAEFRSADEVEAEIRARRARRERSNLDDVARGRELIAAGDGRA